MREIKFRAWDSECEVMVYSDKRNHKEYDCEYEFHISKSNVHCVWWEDYDDIWGYSQTRSGEIDNIMEYTGLKDSEGNEIYEGDIVSGNTHPFIKDDEVFNYGIVKYNDEMAMFLIEFHPVGKYKDEYRVYDDSLYAYSLLYGLKVVGNIYENKELLELDV